MDEASLPVQSAAFARLDSTQDEAQRRIRAGAVPADAILAIVAAEQTAGRGRRGRRWVSRVGNLHMTLVCPVPTPERTGELAFVAAVAAGEAAAAHLPAARLAYKWPNDLMCGTRKLGGILVETEATSSGACFAAVGIGMNVAHAPEDVPATSLVAEGAKASAETLADAVAAAFARWQARWRVQGFAPVRANWLAAAQGIGEPMVARLPGGTETGRFVGIDGEGRLVLDRADGPRVLAAAEVEAA